MCVRWPCCSTVIHSQGFCGFSALVLPPTCAPLRLTSAPFCCPHHWALCGEIWVGQFTGHGHHTHRLYNGGPRLGYWPPVGMTTTSRQSEWEWGRWPSGERSISWHLRVISRVWNGKQWHLYTTLTGGHQGTGTALTGHPHYTTTRPSHLTTD